MPSYWSAAGNWEMLCIPSLKIKCIKLLSKWILRVPKETLVFGRNGKKISNKQHTIFSRLSAQVLTLAAIYRCCWGYGKVSAIRVWYGVPFYFNYKHSEFKIQQARTREVVAFRYELNLPSLRCTRSKSHCMTGTKYSDIHVIMRHQGDDLNDRGSKHLWNVGLISTRLHGTTSQKIGVFLKK
jgi:hypothetical protein